MTDFEKSTNKRRDDLDFLKGIAIIAVVLFHLNILKNGYLGVDVFFVIAGYFSYKKLKNQIEEKSFNYWSYLKNKILRFLPLIVCLSFFSLLLGYFTMLPDDYENLSESVVASNFFANNILQLITTKDYWNVANEFKPLMHTWYIAVLFQIEFMFPLFCLLINAISRKIKRNYDFVSIAILALTIISLFFYVFKGFNNVKFYMPYYRFWEFGLGCLIVKSGEYKNSIIKIASLFGLIIFLILPFKNQLLFPIIVSFLAVINMNVKTQNKCIVNGGGNLIRFV